MDLAQTLPVLLALAWLLPLASFALGVLAGPRLGKGGRGAGVAATGAIAGSFVLSLVALLAWLAEHPPGAPHARAPQPIAGDWYTLAEFGALRLSIGYYVDALTLAMCTMVTLVATCIHVYSFGYMHEELGEVTDPLVTMPDGRPLARPGRFARFFQFMSLFSFSMLGLVIAGNAIMVFVFWELVGVCSYFLIGFYRERRSASNAASKAFLVNRVGDFGFIVGLAAIGAGLGTFSFADVKDGAGRVVQQGIFSQVRPAGGSAHVAHALIVPDNMVRFCAADEVARTVRESPDAETARRTVADRTGRWRREGYGYWLLTVAGLGIFCGCVGKSAQFPLHVWLPDAMEGPTPVSALIHAATMVAAGVYFVGRFYPAFTPEVLLAIAFTGCATLLVGATVAVTATDIKRVLAWSTVSQLGYMMLGLGVGGWIAGLFHLLAHAFFKALLFLGAGSVIHACGTNEIPQMGGLRAKMPCTAWTMLAGCLAISGAGVPLVIGLSGYYSKDAILAQVYSFWNEQPVWGGLLFAPAALAAGMTAFYMFRLWYLTFAGEPRDRRVHEHAHESPRTMAAPLVVLAVFAVTAGWTVPLTGLSIPSVLEQARPPGTAEGIVLAVPPEEGDAPTLSLPAEHLSHEARVHVPVSLIAFTAALVGFVLATAFYGVRTLDPEDARRQFAPLYYFFKNKWFFDELYAKLLVGPALRLSAWAAEIDRGIDWTADRLARAAVLLARLDDRMDRLLVDGLVDRLAGGTYAAGIWLRRLQTGRLREYVMWIVVGTVGTFVLVSLYWNFAAAGR